MILLRDYLKSEEFLNLKKSFYNVVYTKEWLDKLSYTKKGFKKYEPEEFIQLGKMAGFEKVKVKDIVKGKSYVVIYTKGNM